ncbi:MFS transporter [Streptomyces sp. NPDC056159]|uniref:MFS transporter n=1 Tax=Streptomyces sp. NPDC056159 TaxID=3155537 RepID=UPI003444AA38
MGIGTVLVAVNLRAAITSLGAILDRVSAGLDLSGAEAGLLTTLPVVAFAAVGGLSPLLARRLGLFGGLVVACVALVVGLAARAAAHSGGAMLAWSGLALAGIAVANVLLPVVVKSFFPHRLGLMTGLYTMAMQLGSAAAAGTTPLVAEAGGSWRSGLSLWALVAACAVPPWLLALRGGARPAPASQRRSANGLARNPLAWALAVFFGVQSLAAYVVMGWVPAIYRSAGVSSAMSGVLLAVIMALAAPIALLLPTLANRLADQRVLVLIVTVAMAFGWLGLMIAPVEGAWWWAVLLGIGSGAFPLALTLIGLRARSTEATTALSAFAQSAGYMMAMVGPFAVGTMHEVTGSWSLPLGVLIALLVPQLIAGLAAGRNRFVDGGSPTGA